MAGAVSISDEDAGVMSDINVTPLVDVVLVLLIVFMITVPSIIGSTPVRVDLPTTSAAFNPSAEQLPLNISLKQQPDNTVAVYWNDNRVSEAEFQRRLKEMQPKKDQEVSISADGVLAYSHVIHVMDSLAAVGIHKLQLQTKHVTD